MLEKDVEFDTVKVDLQDKSEEFIAVYGKANPNVNARAKVPVLEHNGNTIVESLVVVEYVSDAFPSGTRLMPDNASGRAAARLSVELSPFNYFNILRAGDDQAKADALSDLKTNLAGFDAFLQQANRGAGPFLLEDFSLAECALAPFVQRACILLPHFAQVDLLETCTYTGLDRLAAWIEAVLERPSVIASGVPSEAMVASTEAMLKRFSEAAVTGR